DRADHLVALTERDPAREDHYTAAVRDVDAVELLAWLAQVRKVLRADVERARSPRLVDRYLHTSHPCIVHAHMRDEIAPCIDDGNVHRLLDFLGLFLRCHDDAACGFEIDHPVAPWSGEFEGARGRCTNGATRSARAGGWRGRHRYGPAYIWPRST